MTFAVPSAIHLSEEMNTSLRDLRNIMASIGDQFVKNVNDGEWMSIHVS